MYHNNILELHPKLLCKICIATKVPRPGNCMLKMVETAVRPRPHFSTFLLSDANAGGDGLSYYQYKKLLRSQKVVLLQQKQATAHIPGYKPPQKRITTRLSDYKPDISRRHTTSGTTTTSSSSSTTNDISSSSTTNTSGNKVNKKDVQTQTITVNKLDISERSHKNQGIVELL